MCGCQLQVFFSHLRLCLSTPLPDKSPSLVLSSRREAFIDVDEALLHPYVQLFWVNVKFLTVYIQLYGGCWSEVKQLSTAKVDVHSGRLWIFLNSSHVMYIRVLRSFYFRFGTFSKVCLHHFKKTYLGRFLRVQPSRFTHDRQTCPVDVSMTVCEPYHTLLLDKTCVCQLLNDRFLCCEKSTVFHMDGLSDEV